MRRAVTYAAGGAMALAAVLALLVFQTEPPGPEGRQIVVGSFFPYYEFARNVAGDRAIVVQYMPHGVDAHDWEPDAMDIAALHRADVFVYGGLEPYVGALKGSDEFDGLDFVATYEGVPLLPYGARGTDRHIWLDPVLVKTQVENIRAGLTRADPEGAAYYAANAASYGRELDELDTRIREGLAECEGGTLATFHNAFAYFGQRYGLEIISVGADAPGSEASALEIAEFVSQIRDKGIGVVFAEDLKDPRLAGVIADETGAQIMTLSPIEALGPEETAEGVTYVDKMDQNLATIRAALGCA